MRTHGHTAEIYFSEPDSRVFDLWAQVYDSQPNPLLMLEERETSSLLPALAGCDVLDIGCGTGRWLCKLEALGPASLGGTDCSSAMLQSARAKVSAATQLHQGCGTALPYEPASKTFALASFLLSYLDDIERFAKECARVVRPGGWLVISDMHPVTATERNWKRSFWTNELKMEIRAKSWSIDEVISVFRQNGFEIDNLIESPFGCPERGAFESAGKLSDFEGLTGTPAIYVARFKKQMPRPARSATLREPRLELTGCRIACGPTDWIEGSIRIEGKRIRSMNRVAQSPVPSIDLSGYQVLPGLINAHDHLEFGLFPRLGRTSQESPYLNSAQWASDIHIAQSAVIDRYQRISKINRLWWGAIRNLLCGVTTVCHHNGAYAEFESEEFPVHVVSQFRWSHSIAFDSELVQKFNSSPPDLPFIFHAAEGVDAESFREISQLESMDLLDKRTVLVHGLALTRETVSLINRRGVALITCPTSNIFLFGETLSRGLLLSVDRLALGSDSPITAAGDLLDEVCYLQSGAGLEAETIYKMVTSNAAEILRLNDGEGTIAESGPADLIAVRGKHQTPAATLSTLRFEDVELVLVSGRVLMAAPSFYERLPQEYRSNMQRFEVGGYVRWLRAPLQSLISDAESVLGQGNLRLNGRQVRYAGVV